MNSPVKVIFILLAGIGIGILSVLFCCKGKAVLKEYIMTLVENKSNEYTKKAEKNIIERLYKYGIVV